MTDARTWWGQNRRFYNVALVVAGMVAFLLYALEVEYLVRGDIRVEVTLITTAVQGVGYLVFIGIANLFYNLGRVSEQMLHPQDPDKYRKAMFALGTAVSVAVPLLVPVLLGVATSHHSR
jgi:hypothetical protein